jgi:hypothetical protein
MGSDQMDGLGVWIAKPSGMFAVFLQPYESGSPLPRGVKRIAEYAGQGTANEVVLVEVRGNARSALKEMERKGGVMASVAGNMAPGLDLARSMMELRPRATSCCRSRSKSR